MELSETIRLMAEIEEVIEEHGAAAEDPSMNIGEKSWSGMMDGALDPSDLSLLW